MPAYCLKTTWGDQIFGTRTVRSGYDIAAFSVEPLGYDFDYAVDLDTKVYVKKVEDFLDKLIDKVKIDLSLGLGHYDAIEIIEIDILDFSEAMKKITVHVSGTAPVYDQATNTLKIPYEYAKFEKDLTFDLEPTLVGLLKELNKRYQQISKVNELLNQVNKIDENINAQVTSSKNSLKAAIKDYLNDFNSKINSILPTNLNKLVQPTLLRVSDKGVKRMRGNVKSGTITLLPTSYTGELLAPAYKKFIAVVEVNDAPATAADNAGQLGTILDGSVQQVEMKVEAGKKYKVAYSTVDYKGNIVTEYYTIYGI
jgi:hypothetical protein